VTQVGVKAGTRPQKGEIHEPRQGHRRVSHPSARRLWSSSRFDIRYDHTREAAEVPDEPVTAASGVRVRTVVEGLLIGGVEEASMTLLFDDEVTGK